MVVFDTEITRHIKVGSTNRLTIQIVSETMADTLMSGSQYVAHQLGGILRKIYVVAVPKTHLTDLAVFTSPDKKYINFDLTIKGLIINRGNEELASVKIMLTDPEGSNIPLDNNKIDIVLKGIKEEEFEMTLPVICPNKWDVEHPNLYQLNIIIKTGEGFEQIQKNIGFREIKVDGNQVLINGQPVKLKGVNRHEVYPLTGRSITPELCELDAKKFKAANVNYIRTSHYPPCEEFINWCNKLGLYVELENPISWVGHPTNKYWKDHDPHTPDFYPYLEKISDDNISFFRNHPSIIIWSMGNESFWGPNWEKLARFYAHKDSTRPATFHDQAYGKFNNKGSTDMPVANFHYPGYEGLPIAENFERPLLFGEYAHMNTYNRSEIITDPGVRDAWGHEFNKMWEGMYTIKACLGGAVWSGIDDVFMLPDGSITGYGEWGIIDGWRREKPEYYHLKKIYSPVKIVNVNERIIPDKNGGITLEIENRFDFTNLNECDIFWEMGNKNGQAVLSLEPHKQRTLAIFPGVENIEGGRLKVRIISPQGYEVETVAINIGNEEGRQPVFSKITSTKLKTSEKKQCPDNSGEWLFLGV